MKMIIVLCALIGASLGQVVQPQVLLSGGRVQQSTPSPIVISSSPQPYARILPNSDQGLLLNNQGQRLLLENNNNNRLQSSRLLSQLNNDDLVLGQQWRLNDQLQRQEQQRVLINGNNGRLNNLNGNNLLNLNRLNSLNNNNLLQLQRNDQLRLALQQAALQDVQQQQQQLLGGSPLLTRTRLTQQLGGLQNQLGGSLNSLHQQQQQQGLRLLNDQEAQLLLSQLGVAPPQTLQGQLQLEVLLQEQQNRNQNNLGQNLGQHSGNNNGQLVLL